MPRPLPRTTSSVPSSKPQLEAKAVAPPTYVKRIPSADANGVYWLGPADAFSLAPEALNHILDGDLADQVLRDAGGTTLKKILKGGLHTAQGWKSLKSHRPEVVHGACFRSDRHDDWYFARELQNGVILLKIPRPLFQANAARLTLSADVYYKSGYLWKTLFPESMTFEQIISAIDESLFHPEPWESDAGIKVGYALLDDPLTALKVRVQVTDKVINSAFPTWGQPSTGNNGKPYDHFDSISFLIAQSMVFFGERESSFKAWQRWAAARIVSNAQRRTQRNAALYSH